MSLAAALRTVYILTYNDLPKLCKCRMFERMCGSMQRTRSSCQLAFFLSCCSALILQGATVSNDQIFTAVDCVIQRGLVPYATNAVYLLLGASNVQASSGACRPSYPLMDLFLHLLPCLGCSTLFLMLCHRPLGPPPLTPPVLPCDCSSELVKSSPRICFHLGSVIVLLESCHI